MNRREALHHIGAAAAGWMARASPVQTSTETVIRGGRVVNADSSQMADLRLSGELIAEIGPTLDVPAGARVLDATDKLVIPGGIDPHTHLQGSFVDDLTTGTSAAVAGGITTVGTFAYPQNGENAVDAMKRWLGEVEKSAIGDVFFHASTWPPSPDFAALMPELAALGQPSHKVFMTRSEFGEHRSGVHNTPRSRTGCRGRHSDALRRRRFAARDARTPSR